MLRYLLCGAIVFSGCCVDSQSKSYIGNPPTDDVNICRCSYEAITYVIASQGGHHSLPCRPGDHLSRAGPDLFPPRTEAPVPPSMFGICAGPPGFPPKIFPYGAFSACASASTSAGPVDIFKTEMPGHPGCSRTTFHHLILETGTTWDLCLVTTL